MKPRRPAERVASLGRAGTLVRLLDGDDAGEPAIVLDSEADGFDLTDPVPLHAGSPAAAHERADGLLRSLLTSREVEEWDRLGRFWVASGVGWIQLGRLYDLRQRPLRWPWVERSLCVVSEGYERRPVPDLWAELVVTVRSAPEQVVGVANWRDERLDRLATGASRADAVAWLERVRRRWERSRAAGADLDAAFEAAGAAVRLARAGRPAWARPCADAAHRRLDAIATRHPAAAPELDGLRARLAAALADGGAGGGVRPAAGGPAGPDPPRRR